MDIWTENYFGVLLISVLLTGFIIPKILLIAFRKHLFDDHGKRKVHRGFVPRLGGISFLPSILIAVFLVAGMNLRFNATAIPDTMGPVAVQLLFLLSGLLLLFLTGIADDLIGVRYRAKFVFQIISSGLLVISGLCIGNLYGLCGIGEWSEWLGCALTMLLVIYITNAINLIDGIDGLASGLSIIALLFYSYILFASGHYLNAVICGAVLGTLLPFFYYNVFGKPANHTKIFMGDTGALTIGLLLAYLSISIFNVEPDSVPGGENVVILAIAPIMIPCLDVVRVFMHRVRKGANPFLPDRCHIHHKLLAFGFVQWKALIIILIADAILIMVNFVLSSRMNPTWIVLGDIVLWTLFNMLLTRLIRKRERRMGTRLFE